MGADWRAPTTAGPIVLGTDFGPASAAAERAAISLAAAWGADLVIVHAIDARRMRLPGGLWRQRVDQVRSQRERDAAELVARARGAGVSARVLIWTGDPAGCVVDAARAEGAARIVVGTHGRGPIGRAVAGTISRAVADQAGCPVDVIRTDAG
jgi:nucleotide-binding universal stress UspA family protein